MNQLEITAEALKQQLKKGEAVFFVEVRRAADRDLALMKVRGALRLTDDEMERHLDRIPRERLVAVYSTAPDDEPALRLGRFLQQQGYPQVQVVSGGFKACLTAGLPVEEAAPAREMTRLRGQ